MPASGFPELIAAVHVLLRLSSPRHPPCALCSLTTPKAHIELAPGVRSTNSRATRQSCCFHAPCIGHSQRLASGLFACFGRLNFDFQRTVCARSGVPLQHGVCFGFRPPGKVPDGSIGAGLRVRPPGGADRDRTDDLRLAKPALSQLSYSPTGAQLGRQKRGPGQS